MKLSYKLSISFFLILTNLFSVYAQEKKTEVSAPETKKEIKTEKKFQNKIYSFPQFWHETILFVKQPAKWRSNDYLKLSVILAATACAMPFDEQITNSTQGDQKYNNSAFIIGGRVYGEWYSIAIVAGGIGIYGIAAKDTSAKKMAIELLQAGLYSELVTSILKVAIGRARPIISEDAFTFKPFTFFEYDYHSMPSGHATSAFALSTVLSRHANSLAVKILAYVPAGFTMFSRIYQHQHWLSDEILAAGIGYFAGNWVVDLHEGKAHRINVTSMYPLGISYSLN